MPIVSALIGGGISLLINHLNSNAQKKANRISAAESANAALRNYNETKRQRDVSQDLFKTNISNMLGADFYNSLTSGADTSILLENLANGNTAFSKQLQGMQADARQAVENSILANARSGDMAALQGLQNSLGMSQLGIQAEQAMGAAVSSQTTSGIRSDAGTGDNIQRIQEQANQQSLNDMKLQIAMGNKATMHQMESTQMSASQAADQLRRQANITAEDMVEQTLSNFAGHQAEIEDLSVSMEGYRKDAIYLKEKAGKESGIVDKSLVDVEFWDEE